jgi:hypothetical protein
VWLEPADGAVTIAARGETPLEVADNVDTAVVPV